MERSELAELHFISPCSSVPSVLQHGILCHDAAEQIPHMSVADERVQEIRRRSRLPDGRRLHQQANLYINARNAMLYVIQKNSPQPVCILRISTDVLDYEGVIIFDGNAAADWTRPYAPIDGLRNLDRDLVFARYWTHENPSKQLKHKQIMQAEVLVPDRVPSSEIIGAYVPNATIRQQLAQDCPSLSIMVNSSMFFP